MIEFRSRAYYQVSIALALGSFLIFCNLYLFQPMLPVLALHFSVSATQINWVLASSTFMLAVMLLPWAITSERVGRRKILLLSLFLLPLIGMTTLFVENLWMLTVSRGVMGMALAGFAAVAVAYMAETFSTQAFSHAIGAYISANSLGGISGRLVGGMMTDHYDWQTAVIFMAIVSAVGAVFVLLLLPNTEPLNKEPMPLSHYHRVIIQHLRNKRLLFAMLIGGVNFALFVNVYSVTGFRLVQAPYFLPISVTSMIFLCYLSGTVSARLVGLWCQRYSSLAGMVTGSLISLIGLLVTTSDALLVILVGLNILSFGAFFTHSLAYGWVSQQAHTAKATASALYLVHYYVSGSMGGFYLMYCWQHGGWGSVMLGAMGLYCLIFCFCWRLHHHTHPKSVWA